MLWVLGDIHGSEPALLRACESAVQRGATALLQLGDWGFAWDRFRDTTFPLPVYWIDGNHEWHGSIPHDADSPVQCGPNCWYLPRGGVTELAGMRVLHFGGAASVDYKWQRARGTWFAQEVPSETQFERAMRHDPTSVDLLVTHTPGLSCISTCFPPAYQFFDVPMNWLDPTSMHVDALLLRYPHVWHFAGHMHQDVKHGRTQIVDINQLLPVQPSKVPYHAFTPPTVW